MSSFPLRRMLGVLFLGFIVYRIVLFGSAEFIERLFPKSVNNAILSTPSLQFKSETYFSLAETALKKNQHKLAELFLLQALAKDNTNGRAMALAIDVYGKLEDKKRQSTAVFLTDKLWQSHLFSRSKLASYWAKEGNKTNLLSEWNVLLLQDKNLESVLFPLIEKTYLSKAKTRGELLPYISFPPLWWNRFFSFVSKNSPDLDSVNWLYGARKSSGVPLKQVEYRSYIKRLAVDMQWKLAFQIWNDQLKMENKVYESLVYDGGFEAVDVKSKRASVFEWNIIPTKGVKFDSRLAFGADKKALRVEFSKVKEESKNKYLSQTLMLPEGKRYEVSFKVRTGAVKEKSNLLWRVYCLGKDRQIIGESGLIVRAPKWNKSSFIINVPSVKCQRQLIRLEDKSKLDTTKEGRFWFDNVKIEQGDML